jgi:hypothetical protein
VAYYCDFVNLPAPHHLDKHHLPGPSAAQFAVAQTATSQPPQHLGDAHFVAIGLDQILNGQWHMAAASAAPDV